MADPNEKLVEYLIARVEHIDQKVDKLLQFKWQIVGGSVVLSLVVTVLIQLAALIWK